MKKSLTQAILDSLAVPAFWTVQQAAAILDDLASVNPHTMAAGFSETVDALRLQSIRAVLARGQKWLPATDGKFLIAQIDKCKEAS